MALDLLGIITAAGTGAVTGYLTNNLALKMIFKEYGPFGGVVIKTKDEFIANISALVERDLINPENLESELSQPKFKANFSQTVADLINIYLENRSGAEKLSGLPAWKENYQILSSISAAGISNLTAQTSRVLEEENLEKLLPKSDLKNILQQLYSRFLEKAEAENLLTDISSELYEQFADQSLGELLDSEIKSKTNDFLKETFLLFSKNYQDLNQSEKNEFQSKLSELFNFDSLSKNLIEEIKKIKLADLFKEEQLLKQIKEDSKLKNVISELKSNFRIAFSNSNLKVADLLTKKREKKLKEEINGFLELSQKDVLAFIDGEEDELNKIILEAVEAEIEASSGLKAMSRQGIYSKYKEKAADYGLPAAHLKNYLKNKSGKAKNKTTAQILKKIKAIKLDTFVEKVESDFATKKIEELIWAFYQENKDQNLDQIFSEKIFKEEKISSSLSELLFNLLKKLSKNPDSLGLIIDYGLKLKVKDLLKKEKLKKAVSSKSEQIYSQLAENEKLSSKAATYLNDNFFQILSSETEANQEELKAVVETYLGQLEAKFSKKSLNSFYQPLKKEENTAKLSDSILNFFYNHLPELLEDKVAETAAANLHQLSDDEVQAVIEDFMGKELKPITYLGALLGAAAGLIYVLSGAETALAGSAPLWLNYLSSALLYGGVGWLTNVLAIWMIFNPYQEKKIASVTVPFTPGIVAKNRDRFAKSMGKFVEEELLKADSAANIIENNREEIKAKIKYYFNKQDYQIIFTLLQNNKEKLSQLLLSKSQQYLANLDLKDQSRLNNAASDLGHKLLLDKLAELDFDHLLEAELEKAFNSDSDSIFTETLTQNLLTAANPEKIASFAAGNYNFKLNSLQLKKMLKNKELYSLFQYLLPELLKGDSQYNLKAKITAEYQKNSAHYLEEGLNLIYQQEERLAQAINFKKDEIIAAEKEKQDGLLKNTLISGALYLADLDDFVDSVTARIFKKLKKEYFPNKKEKLNKLTTNILKDFEESDLLTGAEFGLNKILIDLFNSKQGGNLITEVLYLADDQISELLELILSDKKQQLIASQFQIGEEQITYFLNDQLKLEEKLKLLLKIKNIFNSQNIKNELLTLKDKTDLSFLNLKLQNVLSEFKVFDQENSFKKEFGEILKNLNSLLEEEKYRKELLPKIEEQIKEAVSELEMKLNRETLDYLLLLFSESAIDSFKANSDHLLAALDLKELTTAEVEKMDPAEIEAIFNKFAGRYFTNLKHYGWFGGIFGLLQLLIKISMG